MARRNEYEHECLGTQLIYRYNTLRILDYSEEELSASENPFALVMLIARKALLAGKVPEKELKDQKLLVARMLLKKNYTRSKIKGILTFLNNYILFANPRTNIIFEKQLKQLNNKAKSMGIIEQVIEMRVEERMGALKKRMAKQRKRTLERARER